MSNLLTVYRHEKKYLLNWNEFLVLNQKIKHLLKRDMNCPEDGYIVNSLYFDNPYDFALNEKVAGTDYRHKYRLRYYGDNLSYIKLERKSKLNTMTNKDSGILSNEEATQIMNGDYDFLKDKGDFFNNFYMKLIKEKYQPKVAVKYKRIAYVYPLGDLRITFDFRIQKNDESKHFFSSSNHYRDVYEPQCVVMEVKFNHTLPTFIRSILQSSNSIATSQSKYVAARFA
jgi:hypothetical protein